MTTAAQLWNAVLPQAEAVLGGHIAVAWLNNLNPIEVTEEAFVLEAPTNSAKDWIEARYSDDLLRLSRGHKPALKTLTLTVSQQAAKKGRGLRSVPAEEQQLDLFAPVITDVAPRDSRDAMELPFLSLSKQKRVKPIIYGPADDPIIKVVAPEEFGIANIYDWDLVIFCVSLIRAAIDRGEPVSPRVRFAPGDFLRATRKPNTKGYQEGITHSLERLKSTVVFTTIRSQHQNRSHNKRKDGFNWVNHYAVIGRVNQTTDGPKDVVLYYEVELCDWLLQAALNKTLVLTFDPDYFLLDGGYERWLYRLVRKSAGYGEWTWKLRQLYERSGKGDTYKGFAFRMRRIVERSKVEHIMPNYALELVAVPNGQGKEMAIRSKYLPSLPQEDSEHVVSATQEAASKGPST